MGTFPSGGPDEALTVPDETFPFFTSSQAQRFRAAARLAFAGEGLEVTVYAGHVLDADDRRFGLGNIAATCHNAEEGEAAWPELVRDHVERILAALDEPSPFEILTPAQVLAATYPRIVLTEDLPSTITYGREIAPGLTEVLNLDLPETVAYFNDEHVERFGAAELHRAARVNLRSVEPDEHETLEHDGGVLHALHGESMFVASLLLELPAVVTHYDAAPDPELGVFVALPYRHQLAFHALRDGGAVPSLQLLADFAALGHQDAVGDLSPSVYWWHAGGVERVTELTPDGIRIDVGAELAEVLGRLTD